MPSDSLSSMKNVHQDAKKPRRQEETFFDGLRVWGVVALAVSAVGFLVYVPVVLLPNIYDTLLHIRIASNLDVWNVWWPNEAFGFYRPLTFAPMLLTRWVWGYYPAWGLNLLNVGHHAVNGGFLVWLLWRLTGNRQQAFFVGLLFVLFPFSYQAVAVYGHNVHPQLVTIMLVNFHQVLSKLGVKGGWRSGWLGMAFVFVVGLLAHESYVLFGPFLGLMTLLFLDGNKGLRQGAKEPKGQEEGVAAVLGVKLGRSLIPAVAFTLLGAAYIVVYQFLPISRAPQAAASAGAVEQKLLYLMQAMGHPFAWVGQFVNVQLVPLFAAQPIVVLAFVLTLISSIVVLRRQWQTVLLGWAWWLLASILLAIPLPAGYLLNGPRLLYLGSIGVALVWGSMVFDRLTRGGWQRFAALGVLLLIAVGNVQFISGRLGTYFELTQGAETLRQFKSDAVLLVNLPQWLAPTQNTYPLGAEFAQQLGDYLFVEEWTDQNLGRAIPTAAMQVDELLGQVAYGYGVHDQSGWQTVSSDWTAQASDVFVTRYEEAGTTFDYVGRFAPTAHSDTLATFDSYTLHAAEAYICDDDLQLKSVWSYPSDASPPGTVSVFAQLLGGDGKLVSQTDRAPLGLPTYKVALADGWQLTDVRELAASAENMPNIMSGQVLLGVYDFTTGEREAALSAENAPLADNAVRIPITNCR